MPAPSPHPRPDRPLHAVPDPGPVTPTDRPAPRLSTREVEVGVTWLRTGSKQVTGRTLHIAVGTVDTHLTRVRAKYAALGRPATTKSMLLVRFLQDGHLDLDDF